VGTATIGFDHVDTAFLAGEGIGFASAPGSNANSVAEYVAAALLRLSARKRLELSKLTLGIVGVGNVGSRVLALAGALGMRCVLNDPPKKRLTGETVFVGIDELLAEADVVTLHVPLSFEGDDATARMVDRRFIERMKDGAVLINTSRGGVVDEPAVRERRGALGGFVADVWADEPAVNTDTIAIADIATPHIAGYSFDGKVRGAEMVYRAACAFFEREPKWRADRCADMSRTMSVDLSASSDPVSDAVAAAYPIMDDDGKLRGIAGIRPELRGNYFDALRREYPRRYEFRHYRISCGPGAGAALSDLGFIVRL
jgi:erythronate-4-phosphate dehydrogenase